MVIQLQPSATSVFGPNRLYGTTPREIPLDELSDCLKDALPVNTHQHLGSGVVRKFKTIDSTGRKIVSTLRAAPGALKDGLDEYIRFSFNRVGRTEFGASDTGKFLYWSLLRVLTEGGAACIQGVSQRVNLFNLGGYEVRLNPWKWIARSESEADAIVEGCYQALLPFNCDQQARAGLIICLPKDLDPENGLTSQVRHLRNLEYAKKIREWALRGRIIGMDCAGPESHMPFLDTVEIDHLAQWYRTATEGTNLAKTLHLGESNVTPIGAVVEIINRVRPHRIGHGLQIARAAFESDDFSGVSALKKHNVGLEMCMFSNLVSGCVNNIAEFVHFADLMIRCGVPVMFGTDATYMHGFDPETTKIRNGAAGVTLGEELVMLARAGLSLEVLKEACLVSRRYSFIR